MTWWSLYNKNKTKYFKYQKAPFGSRLDRDKRRPVDDLTHAGEQIVSDCILRGLAGIHQYDWPSLEGHCTVGNCMFSKR